MSYYYPAAVLASPADTMHTEERIMSLFYPGLSSPAVVVQDTSALALESDLRALILQARRINLLNKCLAECDALLASPRSSTPESLRSPPPPPSSSPSDSDSSFAIGDSGEYAWDITMSTLVSPHVRNDSVKLGSIAQHQPSSSYPESESESIDASASDSEESFFDTEWITPDGLVPADRLEQARLGARPIDELVPLRPYALSAAGWSQLGDVYMEAVARAKAAAHRDSAAFASDAERNIAFARAAQMRMQAAKMYRIAHQVAGADSGSDAASLGGSDGDVEGECAERTSKLYAPVPVRARRPHEPRAVEWLQNVAELHLLYWQQCQTSRAAGAGGSLRARPVREELDNMEYWYRVQYMEDPNWCPVF